MVANFDHTRPCLWLHLILVVGVAILAVATSGTIWVGLVRAVASYVGLLGLLIFGMAVWRTLVVKVAPLAAQRAAWLISLCFSASIALGYLTSQRDLMPFVWVLLALPFVLFVFFVVFLKLLGYVANLTPKR